MHDVSLIATIAAGFTGAWVLGLLTHRLGLSPIVGYLLAGVAIGPRTPGFEGDLHVAQQLAEIGVILLMFGVGLHFRWQDLIAVRRVSVPGAIGQSLVATALGALVFTALGLSIEASAVLGMAMAVASTVVLMRVLMDAGTLTTQQGHIAVGWLIVEDIFTVVLLVLIPVLGQEAAAPKSAGAASLGLWASIGIALLKLGALAVTVLYVGSRVVPWILVRVARLRSRELFTLTVLVFSIAIAVGSYYTSGASMALGAFLAGMVVAQSPLSHQAAADALPMRDAFAVLFFVSVGMLFDPAVLVEQPLMVLAALGIVLVAKPLAALTIVAVLGYSSLTALTVALGLAQIGEFSFILSDLARAYGLMPDVGHSVIVAAAILSIVLNPLLFRALPRIEHWLRERPVLWRLLNSRAENASRETNLAAAEALEQRQRAGERLAVLVGYGPVGRSVHRMLRDAGLATAVIDRNMDTVSALTAKGETAIFGDAARELILEQAGVRHASHVVLTMPDSADRAAVVAAVRNQSSRARILVRARYLSEREGLEAAGASVAVFEEAETAVALARVVLADTGVHREVAEAKIRDLRLQLISENVGNMRTLRVRSVMVPWTRVRRLPAGAARAEVLRQIAAHRFSRWPVVDLRTGRAEGYLLTKDLIAEASADGDWMRHVRPLHSIGPDEVVEATLARMQRENATVYVVEEDGLPLGMITLEDILEQFVGRIEDEYEHDTRLTLADAARAGGVVLGLRGSTPEQAIRELVAAIPHGALPEGVDIALLAIGRESKVTTDLGMGVAVPHARCDGLRRPLVVFGRADEGIVFAPDSPEIVRLVFLLVTPADQPDEQLALLAQIAFAVGDATRRERLLRAGSPVEVLDALSEQSAEGAARVPVPDRDRR